MLDKKWRSSGIKFQGTVEIMGQDSSNSVTAHLTDGKLFCGGTVAWDSLYSQKPMLRTPVDYDDGSKRFQARKS